MAKPKKTPNLFYRDEVPWIDWTHVDKAGKKTRHRESLNAWADEEITTKERAVAVLESFKTAAREGRLRETLEKSKKTDEELRAAEEKRRAEITVAEVVKQYCDTHIPTMAGTTNVTSTLTRFAVFHGTAPIQSITTLDVQQYLLGLKLPEKLKPNHKTERVRKVGTEVEHFKRIRAFFNKARQWKYIKCSPFVDDESKEVLIKKPTGQEARPCPLTLAQQNQILEQMKKDHPPSYEWAIVAIDTGIRHGEQFGRYNIRGTGKGREKSRTPNFDAFDPTSGIRVKDMNFFTNKLTIRKEVAKSRKQRVISISTRRALEVLREACQPGGQARHPDELIFVDIDGNPHPRTAPVYRLQKAAEACNINFAVFWHGLRHVFGKNALRARIAAPFIQRQYGHATLQQTVDYLDIDEDGMGEAMTPLSGIVEPAATNPTQEDEKIGKTA